MSFRVLYTKDSRKDLRKLAAYIARENSEVVAEDYIAKIIMACDGLCDFPHRGTNRSDLQPGIRTTGFQSRVTIVFEVLDDQNLVNILRLLYGGRSLEKAFPKIQ